MSVIYTTGVKFAGGGIGAVAYHEAAALWRRRLLQKIYCGAAVSTDIPAYLIHSWGKQSRVLRKLALYDPTHRLLTLHNQRFDKWVARQLTSHALLLCWNGYGLHSMRAARQMGAITIVQRSSSHPAYQARLLQEEYARWGATFTSSAALLRQSTQEIEEADYVLIPSRFVHQSCLEAGVPAAKLIEIPFGVQAQQFNPDSQKEKERPFRILFVGQINFRKGVLYLLQAWQALQWPDAELWLLGPVAREIRPFLAPYRRHPTIRFLHYAPNLAEFYRQADVFVFPSIEEGSALVTYEAMASGLPVITTPNAGSLVRHEEDGFLVPIRSIDELAGYMDHLRRHAKIRKQMGHSGRQRIEKYTWDRHGAQLAAAITGLLGEK